MCDKPFFNDPRTTTDYAMDFDPTACPQCNENARKNSLPPMTRVLKMQRRNLRKSRL